MNYIANDLPKNSQVLMLIAKHSFYVGATLMDRIYKFNKMRCNLFALVDILNIEL